MNKKINLHLLCMQLSPSLTLIASYNIKAVLKKRNQFIPSLAVYFFSFFCLSVAFPPLPPFPHNLQLTNSSPYSQLQLLEQWRVWGGGDPAISTPKWPHLAPVFATTEHGECPLARCDTAGHMVFQTSVVINSLTSYMSHIECECVCSTLCKSA